MVPVAFTVEAGKSQDLTSLDWLKTRSCPARRSVSVPVRRAQGHRRPGVVDINIRSLTP